jgi:hypothetical protein
VRRISENADAAASVALTASVVLKSLAIRGLRKKAGKHVFADASRAGEEQRVRHAVGAQKATKGVDDTFVAEESRERHDRSGRGTA